MRYFAAFFLLSTMLLNGKDFPVADVVSLESAAQMASPGDRIVLREGIWENTVVKFQGKGTAQAPLTLCAAVPGKTIFTGASALRMAGEYLVAEGLWFKNLDSSIGDSIEFRVDSKHVATHCRLTNCAITMSPELANKTDKESRWVGLYGSHNRVDRCLVQGKVTKGTTLVVWLGGQNTGHHIIESNYFGPREKLGKNGGETLRVGDSKTSMETASCIVRQNLFFRCDGEAECISNKSCGNLYQGNSFVEVSGTLTLRHGNGCIVEQNGFFGHGAKGTGGIRIIGEDHIVRGNYLENLTGDETRCGITFMMGLPDSPANGYFQVKRARVENNTLVNCQNPILIALEGDKVPGKPTLPPVECVITGNKIQGAENQVIEARCDLAGIRWEANHFQGKVLGIPETEGIAWGKEPEIQRLEAIGRKAVQPSWWE